MDRVLPVVREHEFSYRICFHQGFKEIQKELEKDEIHFYRACIVTDSNVGPLYARMLADELQKCCEKVTIYTFPAGEENKHLETVQGIYEHLICEGFDRKDMLVALGGGVTGDITGFAAATYLRGIRFIQVPTTLLSQVDSSIGGKTGVDFGKYKNMVGAFHQPVLVYLNTDTLMTLNEELFACGMAEIIKAALIREPEFINWLEDHEKKIQEKDRELLEEMICRSCAIKGQVVEEDPKELGLRAILNFGHTIGHAIEKLMNFSMLHGQCVAVGYVAAAYLSVQKGYLKEEDLLRIEQLNKIYHLPVRIRGLQPQEILDTTKKDKKMSHGTIRFILLKAMGEAVVDSHVSDQDLLAAVHYILGD